jgi:hypothetical protein
MYRTQLDDLAVAAHRSDQAVDECKFGLTTPAIKNPFSGFRAATLHLRKLPENLLYAGPIPD